ncbi:MAG: cupin domain-containing protein [Chloroflexi bacterium]|nr:cupin domain-containing protein [Chloroflexota bacterium]
MQIKVGEGVSLVRATEESMSKQGLPYFVGTSAENVGASRLSLNLIIIPPGGHAEAHYHRDHESAIYLIKGRVKTRYGERLEKEVISEAGDFLFIEPNVPHQPFNLDEREPAIAIVARSDPREQESVVLYPPYQDEG